MYNFETLSPLDFEELCRDLLQNELKMRFESFGPGRDLGIDFRYTGKHDIIIQAKHYAKSGLPALIAAIKKEDVKIASLSKRPRRYIFMTSVSLNPRSKKKILDCFENAPARLCDIMGLEDVNNLLRIHQDVEQKHFKLWLTSSSVLERLLKSGIYNRTQSELVTIHKVVSRYVMNESVNAAESVLKREGALIVAGEPGVGKTTLARMLAWLHGSQGWHIYVVDDLREAFEVANEGGKRLIFFDDFLGQIRLSSDLVRKTDQRLPALLERVKTNKNLRFLLTTRDYILAQAQTQSDRLSSPGVNSSRYVLNVGSYTRRVRARMLYNHIYFSELSVNARSALLDDDFFIKIIDHKNFNPRLIDTLAQAEYMETLRNPTKERLESILDNPQLLWTRPYRHHISDESKALLVSLLFSERRVHFDVLQASFARITVALETKVGASNLRFAFRTALKEIEGSFVAIIDQTVRFANPGVREFMQSVIVEDGLFSIIVRHLETLVELRQFWDICNREQTAMSPGVTAACWASALRRVNENSSGTAADRLQLAIELYDVFKADAILDIVRALLDDFEAEDVSDDQEGSLSLLLEECSFTQLPHKEMSQLHTVATIKLAEYIVNFAGLLPLEEVVLLEDRIFEFGDNTDIAEDAMNAVLDVIIRDIDEILENIDSVGELNQFEEELFALFGRRERSESLVSDKFVYRRWSLSEDDYQDSVQYQSRGAGSARNDISTEEIRSMFSELPRRL